MVQTQLDSTRLHSYLVSATAFSTVAGRHSGSARNRRDAIVNVTHVKRSFVWCGITRTKAGFHLSFSYHLSASV